MSLYGYLSLALDIGILPRRSWSREDFANAQPSCRFVEFLSVARVAIAKQIARRTVQRESFQQLPGRPFRRGIRGFSETGLPDSENGDKR